MKNKKFWIRVLEVIIGIAVIVGAYLLIKSSESNELKEYAPDDVSETYSNVAFQKDFISIPYI